MAGGRRSSSLNAASDDLEFAKLVDGSLGQSDVVVQGNPRRRRTWRLTSTAASTFFGFHASLASLKSGMLHADRLGLRLRLDGLGQIQDPAPFAASPWSCFRAKWGPSAMRAWPVRTPPHRRLPGFFIVDEAIGQADSARSARRRSRSPVIRISVAGPAIPRCGAGGSSPPCPRRTAPPGGTGNAKNARLPITRRSEARAITAPAPAATRLMLATIGSLHSRMFWIRLTRHPGEPSAGPRHVAAQTGG